MHHFVLLLQRWPNALVLLAIACSTSGCDLLNVVAQGEDNRQCERTVRTYEDEKACKARRERLSDYEKRRKAQDEDIRLGPKKTP